MQSVSTPACHAGGRRFESVRGRQIKTPPIRVVFLFSETYGLERRLLATVRWTVATAVAFPQKSESVRGHAKRDKLEFIALMREMQNAECRMQNCGISFGNDWINWSDRTPTVGRLDPEPPQMVRVTERTVIARRRRRRRRGNLPVYHQTITTQRQ